MEKKEQLEIIAELNTYLVSYNQNGNLKMDSEILLKLDKVYKSIFQVSSSLSLNCGQCVLHYLNQLASWAELNQEPIINKEVLEDKKPKKGKSKS